MIFISSYSVLFKPFDSYQQLLDGKQLEINHADFTYQMDLKNVGDIDNHFNSKIFFFFFFFYYKRMEITATRLLVKKLEL